MLPQLKGLSKILAGPPYLTESEVVAAHGQVAQGKIRIKLKGSLIVRQSGGHAFFAKSLPAETELLQRFERRRGGFCQRDVKLLHGSQRFAQFAAQLGRRP